MYDIDMSVDMVPPEQDMAVSEARARLAELVDDAEAGKVTYLTRHGSRVAAIVPVGMPEEAGRSQVREFARRFAERNRALLDRLADS
ncbi:MAG TPA: type II toxin-antitoxin system prevent-host-death family antitoxin [Micromonospora sp.]|nr:type II toxin-antitoxin system prevent-host-death family antitoxin [Micromonospora sp.]